jgi:DNA-binding beta-propeller fold protein YncE
MRQLFVVGVSAILVHAVLAEDKPPLRLVQTVELSGKPGKVDHFGFDADGGRLLVSNQGNSSLDVIDVKAGKLIKQVPDQKGIHGIAYDPKSGRIFSGNGDPGECAVIDGKSYEVLKRLPVSKANNVQYDPHSGRVFVGHTALAAIDPARMTIEKELPTPGALRAFRIDPKKPRLFANAVTGEVCVFDTRELKSVATYKLKDAMGNAAMAIDPVNRRLFIGCRSEPKLVILDADTGAEVARLDMPDGIDDMWYDAAGKCIYASAADGEIAIVAQKDADHYARSAGLPTVKQARNSFFDETGKRLYLGVPGTAPDSTTRLRVYEVRR